MAGSDFGGAPKGAQRKKHKRHTMHRLGIRIDMTPMVDVAFLLLTFFMLTTSMNKPQTMEINLPPRGFIDEIYVPQSNLLTIRVNNNNSIYWNMGFDTPEMIALSDMRKLIMQKAATNPKLITSIRIDRKGKYEMLINILDELNLANITRLSIVPMNAADKKIIENLTS